ncbi:alpha/beta fold hydrolase [Mesobacillus foraminis]|uniref:alpha/beta fold hydrolase n=1 Tax=Mesobacillus foraminis TaxID=279826 RepID=UPI00399F2ACD
MLKLTLPLIDYSINGIRGHKGCRVTEIVGQKISAGKFDFFYRTAGTGNETLVLLHGIPTNSYLWMHVIPQLAQKYRVIVPGMIGYVGSDRSTHEDLTLPMQAQHILSLLDAPGFQKVHIIGHDLWDGKTDENPLSTMKKGELCAFRLQFSEIKNFQLFKNKLDSGLSFARKEPI